MKFKKLRVPRTCLKIVMQIINRGRRQSKSYIKKLNEAGMQLAIKIQEGDKCLIRKK